MRRYRSSLLSVVLAGALLASMSAAQAITAYTVFYFSFIGNLYNVNGSFITVPGGGFYYVTHVDGTASIIGGSNFSFTGDTNTNYHSADNQLYFPGTSYVDGDGVSLVVGGFNYNLSFQQLLLAFAAKGNILAAPAASPAGFYEIVTDNPSLGTNIGTLTVSNQVLAAPGPIAGLGAAPMLGFGVAWFTRRRRKKLAA